ncbi:hypothetical protein PRUPE_6G169100 [Prunus persica]|uniref:Uncharacterized protein n=1 Tax=Prunus persica TaxID=3760 RepID=A0A251NRL3_PRUPE|nr:hypothetical protein PRUPE_6G169100 [Prunus persica]
MCSLEQNIDGLTDGSDGNTKEDNHHTQRNNGSGSMQFADNDVKVHTQLRPTTNGEVNENSTNASGTGPPAGFLGVSLHSPYEKIGISTSFVAPSAGAGLPFDAMVLGSIWPLGFLMKYCSMLQNRMLAYPSFLFKVGTEKMGKDF